jgi:CBS-domain-containing membrane protein
MKVEELMTRNAIAVTPEIPLKEVGGLLAEHRISGLPVVDDEGHVLGVVSEADILVKERGPESKHGGVFAWLLEGGRADQEKLAARNAGEAMTAPAITIRARKHVSEAARLMTEHGIKRLPVVDAYGSLVGIVTRSDLVRAFARSDHEIAREIREDVVTRTLWIEDPGLEVRVDRGEVTLTGELERKADADLLSLFVARVPGVISVRSELTWRWDDRSTVERSDPHVPVVPRG